MRQPTVLNSAELLAEKIDLLQILGDVKDAIRLIESKLAEAGEAPEDARFRSLDIKLKPCPASGAEAKMVATYMKNTHGATHAGYELELIQLFSLSKAGPAAKCGNKMLLWHGSRITNVAGILGAGLKVAPPEAPVTGYMFGKGVYFADSASKSANYCHASADNDYVGFLVLAEVALGKPLELLEADSSLPDGLARRGFDSVIGRGESVPDPAQNITVKGTTVPLGTLVPQKGVEGTVAPHPLPPISHCGRSDARARRPSATTSSSYTTRDRSSSATWCSVGSSPKPSACRPRSEMKGPLTPLPQAVVNCRLLHQR